jgi:two-component system CheB/CheR fusion protein
MDIADEPLVVHGDPTRLQQIHVNLLSNAAKYTPEGGHVRLSAKREDDQVCIRVEDTGAGIPHDMLESVFELFVQSHRTLDRSAGGLGVGLTLARSLVNMHGGSICACSDGAGKGSQFIVRLPLSAVELRDRAQDTKPLRLRPRLGPRPNVVVVEDSEDSRELLCTVLTRAGFACSAADSGTAALELIEREQPGVAILDVGLPEMDGFEVARRIRDNPKHDDMFLIALTGYGRASDREASRKAGFDEHLVKPVRIEQLLDVLNKLQREGAG